MKPNWKKLAISGGGAGLLLASLAGYYEGTRYVPYQDPASPLIWNNCQGNTHGVDPKKVMTPEECDGVDRGNQEAAFTSLHRLVKYPLTRNQAVSFADFIYNAGEGKFAASSMLKDINNGDVKDGCAQLLRWVYANGKKLPGLVARRQAEYTICITEEK